MLILIGIIFILVGMFYFYQLIKFFSLRKIQRQALEEDDYFKFLKDFQKNL